MNAVQALRHAAMEAGNLKVTPQCHCVIQTSGDFISILPSDSQLVDIPVYNPQVAYGAWPEPQYPPDLFPIPADVAFEPGFAVGFYPGIELAAFGAFWGWGAFDWGHHDIVIDRSRYAMIYPHPGFAGNVWVHDPAHRGGVAYADPAVTGRFGVARVAALTAAAHAAFVHAGGAGVNVVRGRSGDAPADGHLGGASHAAIASHLGPVGRGPGLVSGGEGSHFAHAQFHPSGGSPHFTAGGPHVGGGAPHVGFSGGGGVGLHR
jgi:hypothetical protein